jgi:hypothetical protein
MEATLRAVSDPALNRRSKARLQHPWFGPITAHQWNWLMGIHQSIHRKQIEEILRLCENGLPS